MIRINGEEKTGYENLTVEEMIGRESYVRERIAVEVNGEIIKKSDYAGKALADGDVVEIVSFVGGG